MIDLETLGTRDSAVILTIAAVKFDLYTGEVLDQFMWFPDVDEQLQKGRTLNASTINFHLLDPERNTAFGQIMARTNREWPVEKGLHFLGNFIQNGEGGAPCGFWCRGASFDFAILKNLYESYRSDKLQYPINHRMEFCLRPLLMLSPTSEDRTPNVLPAHDAMNDSLYQIDLLRNILMDLNLLERFKPVAGNEEGNA
jgi:hypothetical protein